MNFGKLGKQALILLALLTISVFFMNNSFAQTEIVSPFNQQQSGQVPNGPASNIPGHVEKQATVDNKEAQNNQINVVLDPANSLGIAYAENSINKAADLIQKKRLAEARAIMEPLTEWLTDGTEYHANLYKALKDVSNAKAQADVEKELALKFAILRDKASFQLANLYIEEKRFKQAVDKLVDVVRSQPRTDLGFTAYEKLQNIGFTYKVKLNNPETIGEE